MTIADPGTLLAAIDPRSTLGFDGGKRVGRALLHARTEELADLQERLFAAGTRGDPARVLLLLQGMDTAGKGGVVRHVVGAVDPQGVHLHAFKAPTDAERAEHFLDRVRRQLPGPGMIGVFDRSHYEDVLIARVRGLAPAEEIERRYGEIVAFEEEVAAGGTTLVKVLLHISAEGQRRRLEDRLADPGKHWKFTPDDLVDRARWPEYMDAYQRVLDRTSTPVAPWHVVPADRRWSARLTVQGLLLDALRGIDPQWPVADFDVEEARLRLARS